MTDSSISAGVVLGAASHRAGGLYTSVRRLSQSVQMQGTEVAVYSLHDSDSATDLPNWDPLPINLFAPAWPAKLGYARGLGPALGLAGHDLLHQHGVWMGFSASVHAWARQNSRPVMISPRGMLDPWALSNSSWKKRLAGLLYENRNLRDAACLHALNESERKSIRGLGLGNPIAVIPNGIDLPSSSPMPHPNWANNLPLGAQVLLFLGRIHPKKGLDLLLKAMVGNVLGKHWHLVVAGWGQESYLSQLQSLTKGLELAPRVHFVGPLHDDAKWAALKYAHAFVLPSRSEGLPMAVLEAWSCGRPVLMTRACNLPEGQKVGAAIETETSIEALRNGLRALAKLSSRQRHAMGQAGRELVSSEFTWHRIAEQMKLTYEWILTGGAAPAWVDQS